MKKKRKNQKKQQLYEPKKTAKDRLYDLRFVFGLIAAFLPIVIHWLLQFLFYGKTVGGSVYYFEPTGYTTALFIVDIILLFLLLPYVSLFELRKTYKMIFNIAAVIICVLFVIPFCFVAKGTYAYDDSVKYTDMFGSVKKELSYSDITSCEIGISIGIKNGRGIYYDLEFENGDSVTLSQGNTLDYPHFKVNGSIVKLDKALSKHCTPEFDYSNIEKSYFDSEEDYKYYLNKYVDENYRKYLITRLNKKGY